LSSIFKKKKKKERDEVSRHISQKPLEAPCDNFDLAGLPTSGTMSALSGAEGNTCSQWGPKYRSIYQTSVGACLRLSKFTVLVRNSQAAVLLNFY